jgi:hypothetical protein
LLKREEIGLLAGWETGAKWSLPTFWVNRANVLPEELALRQMRLAI